MRILYSSHIWISNACLINLDCDLWRKFKERQRWETEEGQETRGPFGKRFIVMLFKFCENMREWKNVWKYMLWCLNKSFHCLNSITKQGLKDTRDKEWKRKIRGCLVFVFPSPITQNMWVPWLNGLFEDVFSFCFHNLIIWFLSDELYKLKTNFMCFQVMETELWWHFCKYTQWGTHQLQLLTSLSSFFFFFFFSFSTFLSSFSVL